MPSRLGTWLVVLFLCLFVSCFSTSQDRARLDEVNRIWTAFPLYPGMQQVDSFKSSGLGKAYVSRGFRSEATYDEVKRFYFERLNKDGWRFASERNLKDWERDFGGRELKFRRGDYEVTIEYTGERADYGWEYGIGIGWSPSKAT
jgi:hypothetical protein